MLPVSTFQQCSRVHDRAITSFNTICWPFLRAATLTALLQWLFVMLIVLIRPYVTTTTSDCPLPVVRHAIMK